MSMKNHYADTSSESHCADDSTAESEYVLTLPDLRDETNEYNTEEERADALAELELLNAIRKYCERK
jgi:hypothetical protein